MEECKFCKVAEGKREEDHVFMENEDHVAFLDIYPVTKGQSLVIPKEHYGGLKTFDMPEEDYEQLFLFARKVAKHLKQKLNPKFVVMVVEGAGVDHVHIKLYPTHELGSVSEEEPVYPKEWKGTWGRRGPKADKDNLEQLALRLRK